MDFGNIMTNEDKIKAIIHSDNLYGLSKQTSEKVTKALFPVKIGKEHESQDSLETRVEKFTRLINKVELGIEMGKEELNKEVEKLNVDELMLLDRLINTCYKIRNENSIRVNELKNNQAKGLVGKNNHQLAKIVDTKLLGVKEQTLLYDFFDSGFSSLNEDNKLEIARKLSSKIINLSENEQVLFSKVLNTLETYAEKLNDETILIFQKISSILTIKSFINAQENAKQVYVDKRKGLQVNGQKDIQKSRSNNLVHFFAKKALEGLETVEFEKPVSKKV